jgi:hypothetical protein
MQPAPIQLPKKPKIRIKERQPDQRQFAVVPIRAITDRSITEMQLRVLLMFCAYSNRGGLTWVGLTRIAEHFGISINRAAVHTRNLIAAGYIKVLYKGFRGERAHTRQIIYKADMTVADIVAITGEPAPYMLENQQVTAAKGEKMKKRRINKVTDSQVNNLELGIDQESIERIDTLRRAVGSEVVDLAISRLEPKYSLADLESMLDKMLR